ncbi:hypothetical protein MNEG_13420 [Monoraphidium neglectum]|uniref:Uncharacterized protein n=1 Tax=Monoraphidium neglectum TaxID=145388 RepID=A0A0D2KF82_9CHLO|nr:hypothetical protein MNEG_13420 [Monoraphidium neglectum]KIY94543.1 hypothetical protein MNEG_13420 [Monoraphidium neglectum]|eukprot:XP_013893563.1 hypothetical protein MNEG_13420 [Monoraphidium neglectum]
MSARECQLERALSRGEALAADKQRSQAERDGLAAELRSSADLRETLKARNDELAAELGSIREAAAAKKGSPLRWRRPAKASTPAPTADGDADARDGGASSPDFGPMTKQRALFGSGKGSSGPAALAARGAQQHPTAAPGLALAVRGAPISSQHSSDVTAHVTAGALQGAAGPALGLDESCLAAAPGHPPAPLCSRSPELSGPKGPLAAGRAGAGGRKLGGAAVGGSPRAGEGQGFLGGLFGCFSPPPAMQPVAAA